MYYTCPMPNRVRELREARGYSQEFLSKLSGVSLRTIGRLERGEATKPETMERIARVLEVSVQELYDDTAH